MTQKSIIAIMVLVLLIFVKQTASGSRYTPGTTIGATALNVGNMVPDAPVPVNKVPMIPAPLPEAPHHKSMKVPHMEELPHIHRYHKERVKKIKSHHGKCWFLSQLIIVLCHLSMLLIAYLHVTH